MSTLDQKVNTSAELASVPIRSAEVRQVGSMEPVMATPAAFAAGLAGAAAFTGAFAAGVAVEEAADG